MIYWVAVEEIPTKKEREETAALPKLIFEPIAVEARDEKDAAIRVALQNPDKFKGVDKYRLQVVVSPF